MKVINGIIIDGKLYRAVANGKLCSECCLVSDHEKCNEIKPCSVFGNGYIFLEEGKVSQILTCNKEYAELYVAHKGDILKFPEEIETSERDYYEGDFEFKSGCDTLFSISQYDWGLPTGEKVEEYMTLCLHLVQRMKSLGNVLNE